MSVEEAETPDEEKSSADEGSRVDEERSSSDKSTSTGDRASEENEEPSPKAELESPPSKKADPPKPRSKRRAVLALLVVIALGVGGYFFWRGRQPETLPAPPTRADLLDAVPTSPMLLVTVDLDALRASKLGALLAAQEGPGVLGRVRATCGFEPIDSLKEIALVVPASADDTDFGLIAVGDLNAPAILECAEKIISSHGGKPVTTSIGTFRAVRDVSAASGEIAIRPTGPLLVGAGNFLRTMVDTADGSLPTVRTDQAHAALRAAIADASVVRATIVLSARQRATIADEVKETGGRAPEALTAVLAAALGVRISPETVQIHAVVLVDSDAHAKELADAFDGVRKERADDRLLRALGLGQLLDRVRIQINGTQIHLNLELTITEAEILADKLSAQAAPAPAPPPATSSAEPAGSTSASPKATGSATSASPLR